VAGPLRGRRGRLALAEALRGASAPWHVAVYRWLSSPACSASAACWAFDVLWGIVEAGLPLPAPEDLPAAADLAAAIDWASEAIPAADLLAAVPFAPEALSWIDDGTPPAAAIELCAEAARLCCQAEPPACLGLVGGAS
jgi:hypothetical protein